MFSALLALCAGNSRVTGEFHAQRPVTRSFDFFFHLCLNKRLNKNNREAGDLRCHRAHYDVIVMIYIYVHTNSNIILPKSFCPSSVCIYIHDLHINSLSPMIARVWKLSDIWYSNLYSWRLVIICPIEIWDGFSGVFIYRPSGGNCVIIVIRKKDRIMHVMF